MIKRLIREYILDVLVVAVALSLSTFFVAQGDLTTYIATPMAIADGSIFRADFSIMEFLQPNAQSVSDLFCAMFLALGMSWQTLSIIGTIVTTAVFSLGIIAISKHFMGDKSYLLSGFFMLLCLFSLSGLRIGRNQIWALGFYYSQIAFCMGIWAFYFALKGKWKKAFILVPIATLFHFTVGSYCAAFLLVFLAIECIRAKQYKRLLYAIPWVVVCIAVYMIMVFGGSTSTGQLSNDMFVKIHCYLRHPHHHVPSSWETVEWMNFAAYIAGTFLLLYSVRDRAEHYRQLRNIFTVSLALVAAILAVNYIFIEIIPLAFIAKLQPARCVFIFRLFLAGILAYTVANMWQDRKYGVGALVILCATIPQVINIQSYVYETYSGFFVLAIGIVAVAIYLAKKFDITLIHHFAPIGFVLIIAAYVIRAENIFYAYDIYHRFVAFVLMMYIIVMPLKTDSKQICKVVKNVIIVGCAIGVAFLPWFNIHTKQIASVDKMINTAVDESVRILAAQYMDATDEDTIFFGDPMDVQTAYFRLYSERASVVAFKNMPFTDEGMNEWVDRLEEFSTIQMMDDGYYRTNEYEFKNTSPAAKIRYCQKYNATHMLLHTKDEEILDAHLEAGFQLHSSAGIWYMLTVPQ